MAIQSHAGTDGHGRESPVELDRNLAPIPLSSTFSLAYMAQGNWYVLSDTAQAPSAAPDPSFGAGTVSYITGAAQVTLGALPDVGSQIMLAWATPAHTQYSGRQRGHRYQDHRQSLAGRGVLNRAR